MSFDEFGFREEIVRAVAECGYADPTPIQAKAIPHILMAKDLIGLAQTGTGKTAGFILPMLEILSVGRARARMPRSLVLVPTRELAAQVAGNFDEYGKYLRLSKALLTGGTSMGDQMKALDRGVDVLIATPGRLLDLFERGSILLSDLKILVVDEADRMLDMGFIPDIDRIISLIPASRQTLLFSATMAPEIEKLAQKYMFNPVQVSIASRSSAAETVEQFLVETDFRRKKSALLSVVERESIKNAFVFINRKRDVPTVCETLSSKGYSAVQMHGDMSQPERNRMLAKFKDGEARFLVCSDVAARGLDVEAVSHVINYDVPVNAEDYVHRIGRTGRAGLTGRAWTIATRDDDKFVQAIEKLLGTKLKRQDVTGRSKGDTSSRTGGPNAQAGKPCREGRPPGAGKRAESRPEMARKRDVRRAEDREEVDVQGFGDHLPAFFKSGSKPLS